MYKPYSKQVKNVAAILAKRNVGLGFNEKKWRDILTKDIENTLLHNKKCKVKDRIYWSYSCRYAILYGRHEYDVTIMLDPGLFL